MPGHPKKIKNSAGKFNYMKTIHCVIRTLCKQKYAVGCAPVIT